jgi:hypothetical protein
VAEQLGDDYADLLGRSGRLARERAAAHDEGLMRGLVDATTRLVRTAVDAIRRPLDAGLRVAGLRR